MEISIFRSILGSLRFNVYLKLTTFSVTFSSNSSNKFTFRSLKKNNLTPAYTNHPRAPIKEAFKHVIKCFSDLGFIRQNVTMRPAGYKVKYSSSSCFRMLGHSSYAHALAPSMPDLIGLINRVVFD